MNCGNLSWHLNEIMNLGMHPFADTFLSESKLAEPEKLYPLILDMCDKCGCIQSRTITDPEERYVLTEYSYTSSNSKYARDHWNEFADSFSKNLKPKSRILEIGCNDGYLLKQFKDRGHQALGIEASPVMAKLAAGHGVNVYCGTFPYDSIPTGTAWDEKYDLIVANNVLNHSDVISAFVTQVKKLLAKDGKFVFEVPYWVAGYGSFDQIYHEHVTYFTVRFAKDLMARNGLILNKAERIEYHGGSLRLTASFSSEQIAHHTVDDLIVAEADIFNLGIYAENLDAIKKQRTNFLIDIYSKLRAGKTIVAIGAAAKGNTLLNYYNLDSSVVSFVTESSPYKIGKYTPKTRIPIKADEELAGIGPCVGIILSWNLSDHLKEKLLKINPEIEFVEYKAYQSCYK